MMRLPSLQITTTDSLAELRLLALFHGYSTIVNRDMKHVRSYHDLLEDEWEGRKSALEYLRKGTRTLQNLVALPEEMDQRIQGNLHKERLSAIPLWEGVATSLANDVKISTELSNEQEADVEADLRLLTCAMQEITIFLQDAQPQPTPIQYTEIFQNFSSDWIEREDMGLPAGRYAGVFIGLENQSPSTKLDGFLSIEQFIQRNNNQIPLENLLFWFGAIHLHGGILLVHKDGFQNGVMLFLPVLTQQEPVSTLAKTVNGRKETILLVDDEDMIWDVVLNILMNLGYTVLLAADGQEAVEIYRSNPGAIDLVILDMMMPVLNGRDAFYQLKAISPDVKVLLTSGYVNSQDVEDVLKNGAAGFLQKPYRIQSLAEKIRSILK